MCINKIKMKYYTVGIAPTVFFFLIFFVRVFGRNRMKLPFVSSYIIRKSSSVCACLLFGASQPFFHVGCYPLHVFPTLRFLLFQITFYFIGLWRDIINRYLHAVVFFLFIETFRVYSNAVCIMHIFINKVGLCI